MLVQPEIGWHAIGVLDTRFFGYFGLFCATVLVMRVLVGVLRDDSN